MKGGVDKQKGSDDPPSLMFFAFQTLVKTFEVCDLPVRASKFVARKNWVITGAVSYGHSFV